MFSFFLVELLFICALFAGFVCAIVWPWLWVVPGFGLVVWLIVAIHRPDSWLWARF
jgi:hypothetical protein